MFRPKNAAMYGSPTVPELAALYALGITGNHQFVDGNKRVATLLLETFLEDNGFVLQADDRDLYEAIFALSNGKLGEQTFTEWVGPPGCPRDIPRFRYGIAGGSLAGNESATDLS